MQTMGINDKIIQHLNKYKDYDIRETGSGRYVDQKVTPDVLCMVADCVLNFVGQDITKEFTRKNLQCCDYSNNYVRVIFSKPDTNNPSAEREYNKFFGQPLQALSHAHILNSTKRGNTWYYKVNNYELLEYISTKDFFAFNFLYHYLEKVLTDSGFIRHILSFKDLWENGNLTSNDFVALRDRWDVFLGNTPIRGKLESHRIWAKVLNVFSFQYQMPGTIRGYMSDHSFTFSDLLYNRLNWRDLGKDKKLTRKQALELEQKKNRSRLAEGYRIQKAIRIIQRKYSTSELKDKWSDGKATCVHHIFPKEHFPRISAYLENLIKLTVQQHLEKAHPDHKTRQINKDYQLDCLLAKSQSIEESINSGEFVYSISDFIYVINEGLNEGWPNGLSLDKIRSKLIECWSMSA